MIFFLEKLKMIRVLGVCARPFIKYANINSTKDR